MSLWSRISNAVHGDRLNREIEEELQSHMEEAIASGRDPREARRAFGSMSSSALRAREASHSIRVTGRLESLLADVRFGWRQLYRNKVTSVAAVLSLALGIGSCVAAFRLMAKVAADLSSNSRHLCCRSGGNGTFSPGA